jgi:hypothetical protein
MFQKIMICDGTSLNNTMTILPQDTQDDGRPTKLFLENFGGPKCPNLSTITLIIILPAKPPKYTPKHESHYNPTKYPLAFENP